MCESDVCSKVKEAAIKSTREASPLNRQNILLVSIATVVFILPCLYVYLQGGREDIFVELTFVMLVALPAMAMFLVSGSGTTLFKTYYCFSYVFLGLVPYIQYKQSIGMFGARLYDDSDHLLVNSLLILMHGIFYFVYQASIRSHKSKDRISDQSLDLTEHKYKYLILTGSTAFVMGFMAVLVALLIFWVNEFSLIRLIYRGVLTDYVFVESVNIDKIGNLINRSVRVFPAVALIYVSFYVRGSWQLKAVLWATTLICTFPLGIPRYLTAALYLPLLILYFPYITRSIRFSLFFAVSIVYVFPFLNNFRWYVEGHSVSNIFSIDRDFIRRGHFDTYQSVLIMVNENIVTFGHQLLGVLFFYIPRSVWSSKPVGSGAEMAYREGLNFTNISANIYAEGFINFSYAGMVIICVFIAWIAARLDYAVWWRFSFNSRPKFVPPFYLITLGYSFFFLRGDLLSATTFMAAIGLQCLIVFYILNNGAEHIGRNRTRVRKQRRQ